MARQASVFYQKLDGEETTRRDQRPKKSREPGNGEDQNQLPEPRISILTQGDEDELNAGQNFEGNNNILQKRQANARRRR